MKSWNSRTVFVLAVAACFLFTILLAVKRPGYFLDPQYLGGLLFLEALAVVIWKYSQWFFPVIVMVFLLAGSAVPVQGIMGALRWVVLGMGAVAGVTAYLRKRPPSLKAFHWIAFCCAGTAAISAEVSSFPKQPLLKSLSLFLLFLYGAFGARLPLMHRRENFFANLLRFCEALIYFTAVQYFILHRAFFGNPNSLGVVMGVAMVPLMLWGVEVSERPWDKRRRTIALVLAIMLLLTSYSRASLIAAAASCGLFCVLTRRYGMLIRGAAISLAMAVVVAAIVPLPNFPTGSTDLSTRFFYKGERQKGAFASRRPVWDSSIASIEEHPWFGTGFGTALSTYDSNVNQVGNFGSNSITTREHGNSYLAIVEGVGVLGVIPFFCLLILMITNVKRVLERLWRTQDSFSTAVPLTLVLLAGLIHAAFEDWLFAVGYYSCIFFWSFAFMLVDFVPVSSPVEAGDELSPTFILHKDALTSPGM